MTLALVLIAGWMPASVAFQERPDFSGEWVAELEPATTKPPTPGSPAPLPRGDMGSGWGSPIKVTQDDKQLVVEYALFSRYDMQRPLRFVYALDGSETRNAVMLGHTTQVRSSRTAWDGQTLRITTVHPSADPASGKPFTTEVTHRLTLESGTALVVEVSRSGALGGRTTTTGTVYRKG